MSNQSRINNNGSNDDYRQQKIVEDAPHFHSVSIVPPPQMMVRVQDGIGSVKHSSASLDNETKRFVVPKPTPIRSVWNVREATLIPSYYRLERSHVVVPNATAQEVATRVSDCLRKESIAAFFDDVEAVARVETKCNVKCAVRLWSVKGQIVVECQRSSGCCFVFQHLSKAILRAAKNGVESTKMQKPFTMPRSIPAIPEAVWEECTAEGLELACNELKGKRVDAHLLALESLVQLSAATHCKSFCAKQILKSGNELLSTIISLVQAENDDMLTGMEHEHCKLLHRHAICILANCLSVAKEMGTFSLQDLPELCSQSMIYALVRDVADAANKPHEATAACRCLQALPCQDIPEIRMLASVAQNCRHAALEEECAKLLQTL